MGAKRCRRVERICEEEHREVCHGDKGRHEGKARQGKAGTRAEHDDTRARGTEQRCADSGHEGQSKYRYEGVSMREARVVPT